MKLAKHAYALDFERIVEMSEKNPIPSNPIRINPDPLPNDAIGTLRNFMLFLKHYVP